MKSKKFIGILSVLVVVGLVFAGSAAATTASDSTWNNSSNLSDLSELSYNNYYTPADQTDSALDVTYNTGYATDVADSMTYATGYKAALNDRAAEANVVNVTTDASESDYSDIDGKTCCSAADGSLVEYTAETVTKRAETDAVLEGVSSSGKSANGIEWYITPATLQAGTVVPTNTSTDRAGSYTYPASLRADTPVTGYVMPYSTLTALNNPNGTVIDANGSTSTLYNAWSAKLQSSITNALNSYAKNTGNMTNSGTVASTIADLAAEITNTVLSETLTDCSPINQYYAYSDLTTNIDVPATQFVNTDSQTLNGYTFKDAADLYKNSTGDSKISSSVDATESTETLNAEGTTSVAENTYTKAENNFTPVTFVAD